MPQHFFISYSSADAQKFAFELYDKLTGDLHGFSVWLDKYQLKPGMDWDEQIVEALGACQGLLFLMTQDSVSSVSVCKPEWNRALKYKKPVIPLLFDGDAEVPFLLGNRHYLDFTGDFETAFGKLCEHLKWLSTPAGLLQQTKYLVQDKLRDLARADSPEKRQHIEDDIADLKKECARLQEIVDNPIETVRRVHESIARGIERESQPEKPHKKFARSKFINAPPREVPSYFQDRHVETKLAGSFLKDDSKRLLTIVGRGGVGKTVIVCRLLKNLEIGKLPDDGGDFEVDGIVYLSAIGSRRITALNVFSDLCKLLPDDVAEKLDKLYQNPQLSTEDKMEALLAAFPKGRVVLLLDNFEDFIETETRKIKDAELAACLQAILKLPPHAVKVIITTRIAAADLAFINPERQMRIDLDKGLESPFAENILREMDADGKAGLRNAPDDLLTEARKRTRGVPRALEHLFAILTNDRDTSLPEILEDTKKLLPEQVMEVLVGEAFNRLDLTSQQVMQALSIYSCPVSPVAVDYLLQPFVHGIDSAPILKRLVNFQLVRKEESRYYLHPIDREYALSRIARGTNQDRYEFSPPFTKFALRNRGADYFRRIRTPRETWKSFDDLNPQLSEIDLRIIGEDYETAAQILLDIDFNYLYVWGRYSEMVELHSRLVDKLPDSLFKSASLGNMGTALRVMGKPAEALAYYEQALALSRAQKNLVNEAVWLGNMGNCYQDMGQTMKAIDCNEQAIALKEIAGSRHGLAERLGSLGNCYGDLGENTRSIEYHKKALEEVRNVFDKHNEGLILGNLADVLIDEEKYAEAVEYAERGLKIGQELNSPMICIYNAHAIAKAHFFSGNLSAARAASEKTGEFDVPEINHSCLIIRGLIALKQGETETVKDIFTEAAAQADLILKNSPQYFQAWDAKGFAFLGLTLCQEIDHTASAIEAFRKARRINNDAGIVRRALAIFDSLATLDKEGKLSAVRNSAGNF
jgi:tetratricopeptide (TPR) repeat protein